MQRIELAEACELKMRLLHEFERLPLTEWPRRMGQFVEAITVMRGLEVAHVETLLSDIVVSVRGWGWPDSSGTDCTMPETNTVKETLRTFLELFAEWLSRWPRELDGDRLVVHIQQIIDVRYGEELDVRIISNDVGRSSRHIGPLFRRATGHSIHAGLVARRMEKAFDLIQQGQKIDSVAMQVGYRSRRAFNAAFRRKFSCPPSGVRSKTGLTRPAL